LIYHLRGNSWTRKDCLGFVWSALIHSRGNMYTKTPVVFFIVWDKTLTTRIICDLSSISRTWKTPVIITEIQIWKLSAMLYLISRRWVKSFNIPVYIKKRPQLGTAPYIAWRGRRCREIMKEQSLKWEET
jgi:hypothetical protein